MLDYAASAARYWSIEELRAGFEVDCGHRGSSPERTVEALLGPGADVEQFWERAQENLRAGHSG